MQRTTIKNPNFDKGYWLTFVGIKKKQYISKFVLFLIDNLGVEKKTSTNFLFIFYLSIISLKIITKYWTEHSEVA